MSQRRNLCQLEMEVEKLAEKCDKESPTCLGTYLPT